MYRNGLQLLGRTPAADTRADRQERDRAELARRFYCELLGGRQVWPKEKRVGSHALWFAFGPVVIEVSRRRREPAEPLEVSVDSPLDVAARCWDAGHTVRPPVDGRPDRITVVDPFGSPITLVASELEAVGARRRAL